MRLSGLSWNDITVRLNLGPEIYYYPVPATVAVSAPYDRAYTYFRTHLRRRWHRARLDDAEIVNLVNLRFVTEYEHAAPARVMELRGGGHPFTTIYHDAREERDQGGRNRGRGHSNRPGGRS